MSETVAIKIGSKHNLQIKGKKNILSGVIIEDLGDRYLCKIKSIDAYYHIYKDGRVIVYGETENILVNQKNEDGIWLIDVDMTDPITFLFNGMPKDNEEFFFVSDISTQARSSSRSTGLAR